jgi:hypothetical protein
MASHCARLKLPAVKVQTFQENLRRLFRSMDFVSRHPALKRDTAEARRFVESSTNAAALPGW